MGELNLRVIVLHSLMDKTPRRRAGHGGRMKRWRESAEKGERLGKSFQCKVVRVK